MELEAIIGLEIHAQIATKSKMFSDSAASYFGKEPNVNVDPVCLGMPGQLPVINKVAVEKGVRAALALNLKVNRYSYFDRKNYFYPDLPKGYQISQFEFPLSENGFLEVPVNSGIKRVGITRLHLEEDAGKLTHFQGGTLIDYNRSGVGLMEIVSEPDIRSAEEASAYAREIQKILRYTESSDADMEKGMMRFDASVSLRPVGESKLYARAEIKNLNSFRSLETAIKYEIERQKGLWKEDKVPKGDTTVGYDDLTGKTYFLREKEGSDDYRYFPEPDLPPIILEKEFIEDIRKTMPELPDVKFRRYVDEMKLSESEAQFLIDDRALADFFDNVNRESGDVQKTASFVLSILVGRIKKDDIQISDLKFDAIKLSKLITMVNSGVVSMNMAKGKIIDEMFENGTDPEEIVAKSGLRSINDEEQIRDICKQIVAENQKIVQDYLGGKDNAFKALMGQVMKATKGQANAEMVNKILNDILK